MQQTVRPPRIRLNIKQTFALRDWIVANWAAIEQERFTAMHVKERAERELRFPLSVSSVTGCIEGLGKSLPRKHATRKGKPTRHLAKTLLSIVAVIDALCKTEGVDLWELSGASPIDRELLKLMATSRTETPAS